MHKVKLCKRKIIVAKDFCGEGDPFEFSLMVRKLSERTSMVYPREFCGIDVVNHFKAEHQKTSGLLQLPKIPVWKWERITMDFIQSFQEHHLDMIQFGVIEHVEFDESNTYVLERFNTTAGNPVKKILLKLNLSDHRSILTDSKVTPTKPGRMTKLYSSPRFIANSFNARYLKMEVEVPDSS
ncbi:hypothetical protein Tco_0357488 [Tanacetum coccineum]